MYDCSRSFPDRRQQRCDTRPERSVGGALLELSNNEPITNNGAGWSTDGVQKRVYAPIPEYVPVSIPESYRFLFSGGRYIPDNIPNDSSGSMSLSEIGARLAGPMAAYNLLTKKKYEDPSAPPA